MNFVPSSQAASSEGSRWCRLHMGQPPGCVCCKSAAKKKKIFSVIALLPYWNLYILIDTIINTVFFHLTENQ